MTNPTIYQAQISIVFHCEDEQAYEKAHKIYESLIKDMRRRLEDEANEKGFDFNLNHDDDPLEVIW